MYLSERRWENLDTLSYYPYAAGGVYHKNSFYAFGGGGSDGINGILVQNQASDVFLKYTLGDDFPCSKGSYR